ncbi:MAG: hypothetical protein GY726_11530 [Proteobacteria bacterium]|nr:hypothetical protein [Pseudomonadota bacterium]
MEDRWSEFRDIHQWHVYGIIVDRMSGNMSGTGYDSGLYGVMFDFANWQPGDQYLRQGCAIALDALNGRVSGTLYNTAAKRGRFFLETFVHEVGHNFNLPHTWSRQNNADAASNSFMNYPWGYTGGAGTREWKKPGELRGQRQFLSVMIKAWVPILERVPQLPV